MRLSFSAIVHLTVCATAMSWAVPAAAQVRRSTDIEVVLAATSAGVEAGDGGQMLGFGVEVAGVAGSTGYVSYGRWDRVGTPVRGITGATLFRGGWRLQRETGRVRPFFDVGGAIGEAAYVRQLHAPWSSGFFGLDLGGGVAIAVGGRAYIRPQVRAQWLIYGGAISAGIGMGFRF